MASHQRARRNGSSAPTPIGTPPIGPTLIGPTLIGLPSPAPAAGSETALEMARKLYRDRQRRSQHFGADLFGEPAWDMLLDLYIAACEKRQVSTTSACIGANVPVATGLRWLQVLETRGLVSRKADASDARRVWIALTPTARRDMSAYFAGMANRPAD